MSVNFKIRPIFLALFLFVFLFAVACAEGIDPNQNTTANGEIDNGAGNNPGGAGNGDGGVKPETGDPSNPGGGEEVIPPVDGGSGEGGGNGNGDKDPTVPPTPAPDPEEPEVAEDTVGVTHDNLTGGYKIVYFATNINHPVMKTAFNTNDKTKVQQFKGEADIFFTGNIDAKKINIKTKIKFDSSTLNNLPSIAGDQSNQFAVYAPIDATIIDNTTIGSFNKSAYPFTTENYDLRVAKDGKIVVRQNLAREQFGPAKVYAEVHLIKISNIPFGLSDQPYYPSFDGREPDSDVIPVIPAPKPPEPDKPSDFEPIDTVLWTGTYDLAEIRFNDGTNSYSSAYYTENTSDANFSSDVLDHVGKVAISVTADNKLKVVTKYQIETQTITSVRDYRYDSFPLIDAVQNRNTLVIGAYDEFGDSESNFKLFVEGQEQHIVKTVGGITYEYILTKTSGNADTLIDDRFWKLTDISVGKDGNLGYFRITGLNGYLTSSGKFYGNMLIYVDPEETIKNGYTTVRMKIKWHGEKCKIIFSGKTWNYEYTYATYKYSNITDDFSGLFSSMQGFSPGVTQLHMTFDSTNRKVGERGFDIGGGSLTVKLQKVYDNSANKILDARKYF